MGGSFQQSFYDPSEEEEVSDGSHELYMQLSHFIESDQDERTIETAGQLLQREPNDSWLHKTMGDALVSVEQYDKAEHHLNTASQLDPEDGSIFSSLARLALSRGRWGVADEHIRQSIRLDPTCIYAWYILGSICIHFEDAVQAKVCEGKIRELDPESRLADKLQVEARSEIEDKNQYSPAEKLQEYEKLLASDPEDDYCHYSLALIYLNDLKDYERAEYHFRAALKLDPQDKNYQKGLIQSWRKREWPLILLWLPFTPIDWGIAILQWTNKKIWPYVFMIFFIKYILIIGVFCALTFYTIFYPVAKLYEYLTMVEVHRKLGVISLYSGLREKVYRLSFLQRRFLFAGSMLAYWATLFIVGYYLIGGAVVSQSIGLIVGLGFLIIVVLGNGLWIWSSIMKRRRARKNKDFNANI